MNDEMARCWTCRRVELAAVEVQISVAPFAAYASPAAMPLVWALPPGTYHVTEDLLRNKDEGQSEPSEMVASVTLFPTEEDGRGGPPPREGWHCALKTADGYLDARLWFNRSEYIGPGATTPARIRLLSPELLRERFPLGAVFELWEGEKIGHGHVFMHLP